MKILNLINKNNSKNKFLKMFIYCYLNNKKNKCGTVKQRQNKKYSNIKLNKQKGTGKARIGDRTSPILVGGARAFKLSKFKYKKINKKLFYKSIKNLIYIYFKKNKLFVINKPISKKICTNFYIKIIKKITKNNKLLIILDKNTFEKSIRNIKNIFISYCENIDVSYLLKVDLILITINTLNKIKNKYEI
ncbi:MAG: 50S ribosomal protein L4 [Candidatus Vidania fulgoroideorum]